MNWKTNHGPKKIKYSEKSGHFKKKQHSHWIQKTKQPTNRDFCCGFGKGPIISLVGKPQWFSCYQKVAGPMHEMLSHETPAGLAWILKVFNIEVSSVFEFVAVPCVSPQKMDKKWKLTCLAGTWTIWRCFISYWKWGIFQPAILVYQRVTIVVPPFRWRRLTEVVTSGLSGSTHGGAQGCSDTNLPATTTAVASSLTDVGRTQVIAVSGLMDDVMSSHLRGVPPQK